MAKKAADREFVWLQCSESGDLNYRTSIRVKGGIAEKIKGGWLDFDDLDLSQGIAMDRNPFRPRGGSERELTFGELLTKGRLIAALARAGGSGRVAEAR